MQNYGLFIVEDDGEVDWAFPCLDKSEPCSKFGFTCLGLVDLKKRDNIIMASPIPDFDMNSAFQCFPKVSVSGQSNVNTSRLHTGDSDTTEVLRAMNTVIDGEENGMFPFLLWNMTASSLYCMFYHLWNKNILCSILFCSIEQIGVTKQKFCMY